MSATLPAVQPSGAQDIRRAVIRRMIQVFGQLVIMGAVLFVASGQLDWTWAWVYLGLVALIIVAFSVFFMPGHQDLIAERSEVKPGTKSWDRSVSAALLVAGIAMYVVAGLDRRFGWTSELPLLVHVIAAVVMVLGYCLLYWAMLTNRFFATTVRIQTERNHSVVTGGPYRFVRHPGYVGITIDSIGSLVLLGSLWALIPGLIGVALYVVRTALEDKTLMAELPGYQEYARQTRYRLIPGIY